MTRSSCRRLVRHRKLRVCLKDLGLLLAVWAAAYVLVQAFGWGNKEVGGFTLSSCLLMALSCTAFVVAVVWFLDGVLPRKKNSCKVPSIHTHIHQTRIDNYGGNIHQLNTGQDATLTYHQTSPDHERISTEASAKQGESPIVT